MFKSNLNFWGASAKPRDRAALLRTSRALCRGVTALTVALAVLLLLERFGGYGLAAWRGLPEGDARHGMLQLALAAPDCLYLGALWGIRQALAALARGEFFAATLTRMLERVGTTLAVGALLGVVALPSIERLLGHDPGYVIAFDVSGLVLGAVGLSLRVLAGVLRHARAIEVELSEIF